MYDQKAIQYLFMEWVILSYKNSKDSINQVSAGCFSFAYK